MIKKYGVIGYPIEHSLSPSLFKAWKPDINYEKIEVKPEELGDFLRSMVSNGYVGCNITMPHKEEALKYMDEVNEIARKIGAINTVIVKDGKLIGDNTDAYGFIQNIKEKLPDYSFKGIAYVMGSGGAARAVIHGLLAEGMQIYVANRRCSASVWLTYDFKGVIAPWTDSGVLADIDLLVNATSVGMSGNDELLPIDLSYLKKDAIVADVIYANTPLLMEARQKGHITIDGTGMLVNQARKSYELWFGEQPPSGHGL